MNEKKEDWRDDFVEFKKYDKVKSYKLKNGSETVTFKSEGFEWFSQLDNKIYVIFKVQKEGDIVRPFFVNKQSRSFLVKLKSFGELTGKQIVLSRTGERRATRWSAVLPDEQFKVKTEVVE